MITILQDVRPRSPRWNAFSHLQMHTPLRHAIVSFGLIAGGMSVAACRGENPVQPGTPGLSVVSGRNAADTVLGGAFPDLVVEVRDAQGAVVAGTTVRFAVPFDDPQQSARLLVCAPTAPSCPSSVNGLVYTAATDARGRATARVRPLVTAGPAWLRVTVPDLAFSDSVRYTVNPGVLAQFAQGVQDTLVTIGESITLRVRAIDSYGNLRPDTVPLVAATGSVTVAGGSTLVQGTAFGTQFVYAQLGALRDSIRVRVVPKARLLVWGANERVLSLVDSDGRDLRRIVTSVDGALGTFPRFSANRQLISFQRSSTVLVADTLGAVRQELAPLSGFESTVVTRVLADGTVLAVARRTGFVQPGPFAFATGFFVWRIGADNTLTPLVGLPQLDVFASTDMTYGGADISPDGQQLAYVARIRSGVDVLTQLRVLDIASGTTRTLVTNGAYAPRWSPTGDRIAYLSTIFGVDPNVQIVNALGTTSLAVGTINVSSGLGWSPDGAYLIARSRLARLAMIRVADGRVVELSIPGARPGVFENYYQPDWR